MFLVRLFSLCALLIVQIYCMQSLYTLVPDHCEVKNINESIVHFTVKKCYKLSRYELYLNMSYVMQADVLTDTVGQVKITGYQFRSNEYRKGPIEFMLGVCSGLASTAFDIPNMFAHSNLRCPLQKGHTYYAYKLSPNGTNMPPLIPPGKWLLEIDIMYLNKYIAYTVQWYTDIEYDPLYKHFNSKN